MSSVRFIDERSRSGWHALAKPAGISSSLLSEIETGKKDGSVHTPAALARVLVPWS
jgi:hypothetical protein